MKSSPAFQFYPSEYLASQRVQLLTLEEEGAYIRLLAYCWLHGSIPADPEAIARLIGKGASTTLATKVATMFQPSGSSLVHDRLEVERAKQALWREKSSQGGKKSAEQRKTGQNHKGGSTMVARVVEGCLGNATNQKATLQSSSSSSVLIPPIVPQGGPVAGGSLPAAPQPEFGLHGLQLEDKAEFPKTAAQRRAEKLFRRRETTVWDGQEKRAWKRSAAVVAATRDDDWQLLEWWFALPAAQDLFRRKDLATLLNNWNAEIDRARAYRETHGYKPPARPTADIYTEPTGWREKAAKKWPGASLPATWAELSSTLRNDLLAP